jgi:GT2 family glycosyltransferase
MVIDNGSTDGTIQVLETEYPEVACIISKENLGFGAGNNIGLRKGLSDGYDYVFLLNQDAWLQRDTLERLILFHQSHLEYGILSPLHLNQEGTKMDPKFGYNLNLKSSEFRNDAFFERLKPCYDIEFVNAALWLIPRRTLEQIGGFNDFYFMYGEDGDYCARCLIHGMKIGVVTDAYAHHVRYNHHYKPRPFLDNLSFHSREWHSWSYETFLEFDRGFWSSIRASFHRIWIRANQEFFKRHYTIALAVIIGWIRFLLTIRKAKRDKFKLQNEVKPHFIAD